MQCFPPPEPPVVADHAAYWAWGLIGLAVLLFELWAVTTGHHTMTQGVQHGPKWFQWIVGGGLIGLLVHLFMWR